jgi:hypothetical protein
MVVGHDLMKIVFAGCYGVATLAPIGTCEAFGIPIGHA